MRRSKSNPGDTDSGLSGYELLANAIVAQGVEDYRAALYSLKRNPHNVSASGIAAELERFFRSSWFGLLTEVNPDYLIKRIKEGVRNSRP